MSKTLLMTLREFHEDTRYIPIAGFYCTGRKWSVAKESDLIAWGEIAGWNCGPQSYDQARQIFVYGDKFALPTALRDQQGVPVLEISLLRRPVGEQSALFDRVDSALAEKAIPLQIYWEVIRWSKFHHLLSFDSRAFIRKSSILFPTTSKPSDKEHDNARHD